ncbi:MAG: heme oxygenase (biliverdin-producing) [Clostridium sp.]
MRNFSEELRARTKNIHTATETTGFNKRLVDGMATKESYAEYLYNLLPVYEQIEKGLDALEGDSRFAPLVTKELYKSELMKKDIEFILGDSFKNIELSESSKAYVRRLEEIRKNNPLGVIAHAYTRFLADLFGGRIFADLMKNHYKIGDGGLNYYKMDGIGDIMPYVGGYHKKLGELRLNDEEIELFINEVSNSYVYNIGISTEVDAKLFPQESKGQGHPGGHPHH